MKSEDDGTILALSWFRSFVARDDSASAIVPIYGPERGDQEYKLSVWDEGGDGTAGYCFDARRAEAALAAHGRAALFQPLRAYVEGPLNDTVPGTVE